MYTQHFPAHLDIRLPFQHLTMSFKDSVNCINKKCVYIT
jgi:hypothetical protein